MDEKTFKTRTKKLAVTIIRQTEKFPKSLAADVIGRQLIRSGTSMGQLIFENSVPLPVSLRGGGSFRRSNLIGLIIHKITRKQEIAPQRTLAMTGLRWT